MSEVTPRRSPELTGQFVRNKVSEGRLHWYSLDMATSVYYVGMAGVLWSQVSRPS